MIDHQVIKDFYQNYFENEFREELAQVGSLREFSANDILIDFQQ